MQLYHQDFYIVRAASALTTLVYLARSRHVLGLLASGTPPYFHAHLIGLRHSNLFQECTSTVYFTLSGDPGPRGHVPLRTSPPRHIHQDDSATVIYAKMSDNSGQTTRSLLDIAMSTLGMRL